jgi:hypothetical protein
VGRARRPAGQPADGKRRRREVQLPARYSHDYPVSEGHDYSLNAIPTAIWERAKRRAHAEDRSVRVVLIRALDLYAAGRLDL